MLKKAAPSSGSGGGDSIVSYGADGYPCGLWFLFHYLSGMQPCLQLLANGTMMFCE